jgi:hypothetical protein
MRLRTKFLKIARDIFQNHHWFNSGLAHAHTLVDLKQGFERSLTLALMSKVF